MPDTIMTAEASAPTYRNRSLDIKDLAAALCKAQAVMEGAKKDTTNPHFKTKYADLASVWEAVRKPLTDNDLCIVQFPRTAGNGVEIETTLMHGKTGQFMSDVLWVPCSKNDAQGLGSAITYGRRYSLMAVTGIAPEEDDGNAASRPHIIGSGDTLAQAAREITEMTGNTESQYKIEAAKKAKDWVDTAIQTLNLSGQTKDSLQAWWKSNQRKLDGLEERHPTQYERVLTAYDNALDAASRQAA